MVPLEFTLSLSKGHRGAKSKGQAGWGDVERFVRWYSIGLKPLPVRIANIAHLANTLMDDENHR